MSHTDCTPACPPACDWVFGRLRVYPVIDGSTRVEWDLHPQFTDAGPYQFQLQVGRSANPLADDWTDVGLPITDTYFAVDDSRRVYGKTQWTHYRVRLMTTAATYYSQPEMSLGVLKRHEWRLARQILRAESLRLKKTGAGVRGYLLKRRLFGERCPCVDYQTGEPTNSQHEVCYGTGFVDGYFEPVDCVYAELTPQARRVMLDPQSMRGTVDDQAQVAARMLAIPQLGEMDVWVDKDTDYRWYVHDIKALGEMTRIPLIVSVRLSLAPFSDVVYQLPIVGQEHV